MQLTREEFDQIAPLLPRQRGNVRVNNFDALNAILYIAAFITIVLIAEALQNSEKIVL
jgi:hypothetical protein